MALITEIRAIEKTLMDAREKASKEDEYLSNFNPAKIPTSIYDSHTDSITLLSENEIESLVQFYTQLKLDEWAQTELEDGESLDEELEERLRVMKSHDLSKTASLATGYMEYNLRKEDSKWAAITSRFIRLSPWGSSSD